MGVGGVLNNIFMEICIDRPHPSYDEIDNFVPFFILQRHAQTHMTYNFWSIFLMNTMKMKKNKNILAHVIAIKIN
jgi:hypothetical protein